MIMWKKILTAVSPLVFTIATSGLFAAKVDLVRVKPVPATDQIPIADFFRGRLMRDPKVNPSGTHIAALISASNDQNQLLAFELKTQNLEIMASALDTDIYDFNWLDDKRLIFHLSTRKLYDLGLFGADVGHLADSYPLLQYYGAKLVSVPLQNRLRPLVWASYDSLETSRELGVVEVNSDIHSGKPINLKSAGADGRDVMRGKDNNELHITNTYPKPGGGLGTRYLADKEGRLEFGFTAAEGLQTMHKLVDGAWVKCPVDLELIDVVDAGNKPGELAVVGPRNTGKPRPLQFMDGASGQVGEALIQDEAYDFNGTLFRDAATREIIGAVHQRGGPQSVWFNEDYRNLQKIINGILPGLFTQIIGNDELGKVLLVSSYSDRQPPIYHWVDLATRQVGLIKNSAPWIDPARMQPMNIMKFKTRDGHRLDAYLTMPAGASKENPPPLVVLPHGGPLARDTWGFNGEVQFLASRGYAVLQPNYRGSPGYSWMFPEEDDWAYLKMHEDVTDATKLVVSSGLVDGQRVAIMGTGFGGYLALAGVTNEPSLYRCAVTIAGVFDWELYMSDIKYNQYDSPAYARMLLKLGDPDKRKAKFDAISPLRHVDRIVVPVFVARGEEDKGYQLVEITQSKRLISELKNRNVAHEVVTVNADGPGMIHDVKEKVELYSEIETFLAKNLAPRRAR